MNIPQYENYQEKKHHGEIEFPFITYICTIPLDFEAVPLHWHEEMEIIYIKKGSGVVAVNLIEYEVSAGSIIFVLPGQLHSIYQLDGSERMEYENMIFNTGILISKYTDTCNKDFLMPLISGKVAIPVHVSREYEHYDQLARILDDCDRIRSEKPHGEELYLKSQLYMLLYVLENKCKLQEPALGNNKSIERMKEVIKYVELHYAEHISVDDVARVASCSSSHFMKCFKETFNCSFVEYLKEYRLTLAARIISQSDGNILEVAESVGFDNLSYFTRSFKAKYGVTPGKYVGKLEVVKNG